MKKSVIIGKRQILLALLIVALGVAVYLNWHFSSASGNFDVSNTINSQNLGDAVFVNTTSDTSVSSSENGYFATARADRKSAREEALAIYKDVVDDIKSDSSQVAVATEEAAALAKDAENESNIETLVKAKGFAECVAVISNGSVNVIVQSPKLLASDTVQIQDIASSVTGFPLEKIKIIEINS